MGNDLQTRLLSEGHPEDHKFVYMCPGNKIPNWFIHCKEVLNSNSFEIDIDELADLDGEIIRIAFCVVIGTKARQDEDTSTKMTESEQHEDEDSFSKITEGGQDEDEDEDTFSEITETGQDEDEDIFYETTEGGQDEEDTFYEITEGGQDEDTFYQTTESGQDEDEDTFAIVFEVINGGVKIYSFVEDDIPGQFHSDHVWLHYNVPESFKLKGDNLQVKFKLRSMSLSFKSCGFHLE
ncbi:uncharacterized protein LOC132184705 [Corylus avellana]|uniref:uncharacterized protein LOC132184705 n=1 Tax=Corylus avellana TaxID=13451 RepID=UPI00286B4E99|nr:uncharacterized protein LOC132184705 [Corylus avellana]XP_059454414.1 uncharacterized protein LOC132184705 [Corylus avellana]XP_059454415.1 uncharacterized protein LOC132184705 [Corylus avellana]